METYDAGNELSLDGLEKALNADGKTGGEFDEKILVTAKKTYEEFIELLYEHIQKAGIFIREAARPHLMSDNENAITAYLTVGLKMLGYSAYDGETNGGHVDLTVGSHGYKWRAEAKIKGRHSSYNNKYLYKGFNQITICYNDGFGYESGIKHTGLLIYLDEEDKKVPMDSWKQYLIDSFPKGKIVIEGCKRSKFDFTSIIDDPTDTSQKLHVKHFLFHIYHKSSTDLK